jgi:enterochelin esterase-like enzyme
MTRRAPAPPEEGRRDGALSPPGRRWLAIAASAIAIVMLVAAGVVGASRYVSGFWLYRGFAPPVAPHSVTVRGARGTRHVPVVLPSLQSITVRSPALGGYADPVYVLLPPGYASHPRQHYPVLYLLHGFPGLATGFLNIGQVATTEATLVAAGRMRPIIMVLPTGPKSFLTDEEWVNGIHAGSAWDTFVARDLVNAIAAHYRTISRAGGRGIGGLSAGGYGALNIGLHHPGEFALVQSWSGYMWADHIPAVLGHNTALMNYNSPAKWISVVAPQLRAEHAYIWFYIGASDPQAAQNRAFAAKLTALRVAHRFFEPPGTHNWRLWRGQVSQALITASEHLSHG